MATLGNLLFRISADPSAFNAALKAVETQAATSANKVGSSIGALQSSVSKMAGALGLTAISAGAIHAAEKFEQATFTIRRVTGATGEKLAALDQSFMNLYKTSARSSEEIATALSRLAVESKTSGKELESLTSYILKYAKVTGQDVQSAIEGTQTVFKQFRIEAANQAAAMDTLYRIQQATGISANKLTASLAAAGPILQSFGFSFREAAVLVAQFEEKGRDVQSVTGAMARAMKTFAEAGKDPKKALFELIAQMEKAPSTAAAVKIALDQIGAKGGSAVILAEAARAAAFRVKEVTSELDKNTDTVAKAASETKTFRARLVELQHQLEATVKGFEALIVSSAVLIQTGIFSKLGSAFMSFGKTAGGAIAGVVGGIGTLSLALAGLVSGIAGAGLAWMKLQQDTAGLRSLDAEFSKWVGEQVAKGNNPEQLRDMLSNALSSGALSKTAYAQASQMLESRNIELARSQFSRGITIITPPSSAGNVGMSVEDARKVLGLEDLRAKALEMVKAYESLRRAGVLSASEIREAQQKLLDISNRIIDQTAELENMELQTDVAAHAQARLAAAYEKVIEAIYESQTAGEIWGKKLELVSSDLDAGRVAATQYALAIQSVGSAYKAQTFETTGVEIQKPAIVELALSQGSTAALRRAADAAADYYNKLVALRAQGQATDIDVRNAYQAWTEAESKAAGLTVTHTQKISDMSRAVTKAFDHVRSGIAQCIVEWENFGKTGMAILKELAKGILEILIGKALNPLANAIGGIFGTGTSAAASVGSGAAAAGAGTITTGSATASTASTAVSSGLKATLGTVFSGISAAGSIIGAVTGMRQEGTLNAIEHEARYSQIHLLGILEKLNQYLPVIRDIHGYLYDHQIKALAEINTSIQGGGSGGGSGLMTFNNCTFGAGLTQAAVNSMFAEAFRQARLAGAKV